MSKIGKKPIAIPAGIEAKLAGGILEFKGKEGSLSLPVLDFIDVELKDNNVLLKVKDGKNTQARANWGTMAALVKNAILGVSQGFTRVLEIEGIGFRASMEGKNLVLNVGFTHPVKYATPEGIKISVEKSQIKVSGSNKALVGQAAAEIRKIKKPEPYKGKGIKYQGEVIKRKAGKKVAGAAAGAA